MSSLRTFGGNVVVFFSQSQLDDYCFLIQIRIFFSFNVVIFFIQAHLEALERLQLLLLRLDLLLALPLPATLQVTISPD